MTAPRLSPTTLPSVRAGTAVPRYDRNGTSVGIVHIGPGAFHRAHQASYVDALLHTDPRWAISALSLKSPGVRDALEPQDGLYTLTELGSERRVRVIGAIREVLVAPDGIDLAFKRLCAAETRMVTMTVTEKGYCLNARGQLDEGHPDIVHDRHKPDSPKSVIGWLTESLRRRRAARTAPFTVVSCDNLPNNGSTLRAAVVAFANGTNTELARWIDDKVAFPRTMVDSITPATDDTLRRRVADDIGIVDAWPVQREPFTQWVIEDLPAIRVADWRSVGVTLAGDVSVYERAKLRLLNGAHSTLAYVGILSGHETVLDAMNDTSLAGFAERLMRADIASTLGETDELDVSAYIAAVLGRFRNPGVRHLLSQIAWDGSKKLPVRLMGTIGDALSAGRPVRRLVLPIAAWMRFIARQSKARVAIVDPDAANLTSIGLACNGVARHDVPAFVSSTAVIPRDLAGNAAFMRELHAAYDALSSPAAALRTYS